jgi:hypothetical protein
MRAWLVHYLNLPLVISLIDVLQAIFVTGSMKADVRGERLSGFQC